MHGLCLGGCLCFSTSFAGNAVFAKKFSNFKPTDTYLGEPRPTRAKKPYVNMFRVVNKNDVVPKVSQPCNAHLHAGQVQTYSCSHAQGHASSAEVLMTISMR